MERPVDPLGSRPVDSVTRGSGLPPSVQDLRRRAGRKASSRRQRPPNVLGVRMNRLFTAFVVGAMVLGVIVGYVINQSVSADSAKEIASNLSIVTDLFLRLIKMIIAPLVFTTLVAGIAHMGDASE